MAETSLFSLEHVSFAYAPNRTVLEDICFSLYANAKVGLYGPNGSGKTTLFRIITGLTKPQSGRLLFHGQPVSTDKDFRALRKSVGLVLQHAEDQLFCPTVLEDVAFGPLNLGLSPDKARTRALETLELVGLSDFADRLTHRLSGGEKKLVSLATVLSMQPEALLLDEPTNGLDAHARERIIELLQKLPTARIIISHDWDFLEQTTSSFQTIWEKRLTGVAPSLAHIHTHVHPHGDTPHKHE